ncbi:hypothetical protein HK098_000518 [Nowakowskiella sp. JEL0407]|nr:hypothetical protein HK098_000518 [Nowakowskiella sp. JEL0407]
MDFKQDESYTPQRILIRSGTTLHDLQDLQEITLNEPMGWLDIDLNDGETPPGPLRANIIQLSILTNHQNGKDSHLRQLKIKAPKDQIKLEDSEAVIPFSSDEFQMFSDLR